nr:SMP-30/gluconolactonase/LRE family protein [Niabella ginsenosidivorans]
MIEVACYQRAQLGEGPVWDEQTGCIYWIDIIAGVVHQLNVQNNRYQSCPIGQMIGAVTLCTNGNLLVAAKQGPGILNLSDKTFVQYPFQETGTTNNRFNDGKCDVNGRW